MSEAGATREFILSLRRGRGGSPCGTLRAVGDRTGTAFEGWIGLIGLITELGVDTGGASHPDVARARTVEVEGEAERS